AATDSDGDSFKNLEEYLANTNPTNSASSLRILKAMDNTSGFPVILWQSIGGTRYRVQYSDGTNTALVFQDIVQPATAEIDPASIGASSTITFVDDFTLTPSPVLGMLRYYRIKVVR